MRKKKDEVVTVKVIANLSDVMFEPEENEMYKMIIPIPNTFTIQAEVTEEVKKEIEKLIAEGINNNENKR